MKHLGRSKVFPLSLILVLLAAAVHLRILAPVDRGTLSWVNGLVNPGLDPLMSGVTLAGESMITTGLALAFSVILLVTRGPRPAMAPFLVLLVFPALASARLLVYQPLPEEGEFGRPRIGFQATRSLDQTDLALKEAFEGATKAAAGEGARPSTFPSGHAARVLFLAFLTAWLVAGARPMGIRLALYAAAVGLVLLVGWSRLYFGYHWLSDVLGGYLVGALLVALASLLVSEDGEQAWQAQPSHLRP